MPPLVVIECITKHREIAYLQNIKVTNEIINKSNIKIIDQFESEITGHSLLTFDRKITMEGLGI